MLISDDVHVTRVSVRTHGFWLLFTLDLTRRQLHHRHYWIRRVIAAKPVVLAGCVTGHFQGEASEPMSSPLHFAVNRGILYRAYRSDWARVQNFGKREEKKRRKKSRNSSVGESTPTKPIIAQDRFVKAPPSTFVKRQSILFSSVCATILFSFSFASRVEFPSTTFHVPRLSLAKHRDYPIHRLTTRAAPVSRPVPVLFARITAITLIVRDRWLIRMSTRRAGYSKWILFQKSEKKIAFRNT